jgi:hypothetical protein
MASGDGLVDLSKSTVTMQPKTTSNATKQFNTASKEPEMLINSYLLVNNFGLTDYQIMANSGCVENMESIVSEESSSKAGVTIAIESNDEVYNNELPCSIADEIMGCPTLNKD